MARSNPSKIALEALSLLDLQLKLSQHPSWRILEISRLKFGFKVILQKRRKNPGSTSLSPVLSHL